MLKCMVPETLTSKLKMTKADLVTLTKAVANCHFNSLQETLQSKMVTTF